MKKPLSFPEVTDSESVTSKTPLSFPEATHSEWVASGNAPFWGFATDLPTHAKIPQAITARGTGSLAGAS
jgi:hypothetical protein